MRRLQHRIFMAKVRGDVRKVQSLQRLLASSWSAKLLAVRKVAQENGGRKTPGIDAGSTYRLYRPITVRHPITHALLRDRFLIGSVRVTSASACFVMPIMPSWTSIYSGMAYLPIRS